MGSNVEFVKTSTKVDDRVLKESNLIHGLVEARTKGEDQSYRFLREF